MFQYLVNSFGLHSFSVTTFINLSSHEDGPSNSLAKAYIRPGSDKIPLKKKKKKKKKNLPAVQVNEYTLGYLNLS